MASNEKGCGGGMCVLHNEILDAITELLPEVNTSYSEGIAIIESLGAPQSFVVMIYMPPDHRY